MEAFVVLALVLGGWIGYESGFENQRLEHEKESNKIKVERVTPEFWGPNAHEQMLKTCARECKRTGGIFRNYNSIDSQCECNHKQDSK